jgi:hypothetical protein
MLAETVSIWDRISAVATGVQAIVVIATVVVTAIFARRQLREALATRYLQSVLGLFEQMERGSVRGAGWLLYHHRDTIDELLSKEDGLSQLDNYLKTMSGDTDGPLHQFFNCGMNW